MFYITVSNGLLTPEHKERMGIAVWEFMWCIDKVTKIDDEGKGWVLGGKPIKLSDIGMSSDNRVSLHLEVLRKEGYIETIRTPYGMVIKVLNAKKRFTKSSDSPKAVIHRKQERDSSFSRGDSPKTVDTKKTIQRQYKDTTARAEGTLKAKKRNMRTYNENQHTGDDLPDLDLESGEILNAPVKKKDLKKASPAEEQVFDLFKVNPARAMWGMRPIERAAAKILFETFGIDELERRMEVIKKNENEPWCPQIDTPAELLEKMPKMERYLKTV